MARLCCKATVVVFMALLAACGGPSIDSTSYETFTASIEDIKRSLPDDRRRQFTQALEGLRYLASENAMIVLADSTRIDERLMRQLNYKNAEEVVALWEEERDSAIEKLEEKKAYTEAALEALRNIEVKRARFYAQRGQPVVELLVRNDTPHTISRLYFHGRLVSLGDNRTLVEDDFNYKVPGGMRPGASATWNFALLSPVWEKAVDAVRAKLDVTVTRIDGEDEQPIYDAYTVRFSARDARRLEKLKSDSVSK